MMNRKWNAPGTLLFCLLVLAGLPRPAFAQAVQLLEGKLVLPLVQDGSRYYSLHLQLVSANLPLEFLLVSQDQAASRSGLSAWYEGNTLVIPELSSRGKRYWAELREIRSGRFEVEAYGLLNSANVPAMHPASIPGWRQLPGAALDIGVGADGTVWVIGEQDYRGHTRLYRFNGGGWDSVEGSGIRLDVDPWGRPWVVSPDNSLYLYDYQGWRLMHGGVTDVGIGADGSVWVLGLDENRGGFGIYTLDRFGWLKVPGSAVRIDVDPEGRPWVINHDDEIFRWDGSGWERLPGYAKDIGIGADGTVWAIGSNKRDGGYGVFLWTGSSWQQQDGSGHQISVDPQGNPWVINKNREIWLGLFH